MKTLDIVLAGRATRLIILAVFIVLSLILTLRGAHAAVNGIGLVAVGPVMSDNGFPVWYKDSAGTRLELCLEATNPLCGFVAGDIPNPAAPLVVPNNFPDEAFWMLGSAGLTTNGTGRATLVLGLEAAFSVGPPVDGDQISFGRVRIWVDNLVPGATYIVTHPYGRDVFPNVDAGTRGIRYVQDIGIGAPGDFTGALNSRIGPFLKWTATAPLAPAGFIGDPNILHAVTGSPNSTNFFRIEGPAGSFTGSPNLCANPALGADPVATTDCIETTLFSLMGKFATNGGVTADRATYSRPAGSGGGTIDVYATSEASQPIEVARGTTFGTTLLDGDSGRYYGRIGFTGATPATLKVRNSGDVPITEKTITVVDLVTITRAEYNSDTDTLTVAADSSDQDPRPALTITGFGALSATGTSTFANVAVPPNNLTVTSAKGGTDTQRVTIIGSTFAPLAVFAAAGTDQVVQQGQVATLDGSGSTGDIDTYQWAQVGGPAVTLSNANTKTATFTAPTQSVTLTFSLTVSRLNPPGPGSTDTDQVALTVALLSPPIANAGPDRTLIQGTTVTLDGSASSNASGYSWAQTAGPAAALSNPTVAKPTFVFPVQNQLVTFQLTVTGPGGAPSSDLVTINPVLDTITAPRTEYTVSKLEWRSQGTATVLGPTAGPGNTITLTLNKASGAIVLGTTEVDNLGAWAFRLTNAPADKRGQSQVW
ncbi:MAG: IPT/TIG domain protein [Chloroflexi bacterium]|nr:IPT/TIG domain protein [Chloroflexota bacterium]